METAKDLIKVNSWRKSHAKQYVATMNYIHINYKQLLNTYYKYDVSVAEQVMCQCNVPLHVANHLVELQK